MFPIQLALGLGLVLHLTSCTGGGGSSAASNNGNSFCEDSDKSLGVAIGEFEFKEAVLKAANQVEFDLYLSLKNCVDKELKLIQVQSMTLSGFEAASLETISFANLNKESSSSSVKMGRFKRSDDSVQGQVKLKIEVDGEVKEISKAIDLTPVSKPDLSVSSVEMVLDSGSKQSNDNLLIDPGERLSFKIETGNLSIVSLEGLSLSFESLDPHFVIDIAEPLSLGLLGRAEKKSTEGHVSLSVDPAVIRGATGNIKVIIRDSFSNEWEKMVPLTVSTVISDLTGDKTGLQVISGVATSNGDDIIDPGERVSFTPVVLNNSALISKNVQVKVTSNSSFFEVLSGGHFIIGDLAGFANAQANGNTIIAVATNTPRGLSATISYEITNEFGDVWNYSFTLKSNAVPPTPRKTQVLSLRQNMEAIGFATDSTHWYLLVRENYGSGVYYYNIFSKTPSEGQFAYVCGFAEEAVLNFHLAVDDTYFYLTEDYGFRRLTKSSCTLNTKYAVQALPHSNSTNFSAGNRFSFSVSNGKILYSNALSSGGLSNFTILTNQSTNHPANLTYLTKNLDSGLSLFTSYQSVIWAYDSANKLIWKLNSNYEGQAQGAIPSALHGPLMNSKVIATQDGEMLVALVQDSQNQVKLMTLDVAHWQTGADQAMAGNLLEESITLGDGTFFGCGSGRLATSAPGCVGLQNVGSINLGTDVQIRGVAADSQGTYLLTYENLGNSIFHNRIYLKAPGETAFNIQCSFLDDGVSRTGITVDETYFYVNIAGAVEKYLRSDCSYSSKMSFSYANLKTISFDGGKLFYALNSSSYELKARGVDGSGPFDYVTYQTFGVKTLLPISSLYLVRDGVRWVFDRGSNVLWKLNSFDKAIGWVYFDPLVYSDLKNIKSMTLTDNQGLIIAAEATSGSLKLFEISLADFALQAGNQNNLVSGASAFTLNRSSSSCPAGSLATTSGGCMSIKGTATFTVPADSAFVGFTADETDLFVAIRDFVAEDFNIFKFNFANSSLTSKCSMDDSMLRANLAVDAGQFYVGKFTSLGVIDKSSCVSGGDLTPSGGLGSWSASYTVTYPFSLSVSGGSIYYSRSGNPSDYGILNLSTSVVTNLSTNQQVLGSKTFDSARSQLLVYNSYIWAVDRVNSLIWKLDSNFKPVAWSVLPVGDYPALGHVKGVATKNGHRVFIATEMTFGTVQIFEFDLSSF